MTERDAILQSYLTYAADIAAFVRECVSIYDATGEDWVRFDLWPAQAEVLGAMAASRKLVILKARQLGITWLCLAYALWLLIFRAPATVLLFSLREEEAKELLWRLRGMYDRLPPFLRARAVTHSNETRWILSNGSRALAFSTRAGRSYTGTLALVDEADFVPELSQFLNAVKPTVDGGGQLFLVSTVDKKRPQSAFKNLFRAAVEASGKTPFREDPLPGRPPSGKPPFPEDPLPGRPPSGKTPFREATLPGRPPSGKTPFPEASPAAGGYQRIFLPWSARPGRDETWRATVQAEMFAQRGTHDDFYAEYPGTAEEALAAEQLDRRLPWEWVRRCQRISTNGSNGRADSGLENGLNGQDDGVDGGLNGWPGVPGLVVWEAPVAGRRYVIGADPAEGNPNSDESAACVLDGESWAQVAELAGRIEPSTFAQWIDQVGQWYNGAEVLVERNNHGHLVIRELQRLGHLRLLAGFDGRWGWLSNVKGKPLLYGLAADAIRDGACTIRSSETAAQLASIEASTLHAPAGLHDDRADAFALAIAALTWQPAPAASSVVPSIDSLRDYDTGGW